MEVCQGIPPEELLQAIDQFNQEEWFECHETLEELWVGARGELRDFYQGLLQLAVALHHWRSGNLKGALTLFKGSGDLLSRVSPLCQGVDVEALRESAGKLHEALSGAGAEERPELPAQLIPRVRLVPSA